jgi:L-amino acid N-acyltransferase YncA
MEIREATPDDWAAIFPIFRAVVDAGKTYTYPGGLTSDEARSLWMVDPPGRIFVAVEHDTIVGTAKMGPNQPGRGSHVANASFMVGPEFQGQGAGLALATAVLDYARRDGYRGMQFNAVVETNESAVRLWQALGFTILATVPGAFKHADGRFVGLHVMFIEL